MAKLLTALAVKNLKPRDDRYAVPVGGARVLYANKLPSGHQSYSLRYRFGGKTRNLTLDAGLTLAEARAAATAAWVEIERGVDPAAKKREAKKAAKAISAIAGTDAVESH